MVIRRHYRNLENRKAELDPTTFAHPEDWQREPRDRSGRWLIAALICGGLWGAYELIF